MTTAPADAREALKKEALGLGWQRKEQERIDLFRRDDKTVRVLWQGSAAISGAARFEEYMLLTTTRDLDTVRKWLAK